MSSQPTAKRARQIVWPSVITVVSAAILIGADMVEPASRPGTAPGPEAIRFNSVSARRLMVRESPMRPIAAA